MQDRGPQLEGVVIALLSLAVVAFSLRAYVRLVLTRSFGYDDWIMFTTLILFVIHCILSLIGIHYGYGKHQTDLTPADYSAAMKMWFACEVLYALTSSFTKLAAGTLLLRLITRPLHVRIIWSVMAFTTVFGIAFVAEILAQCQPIAFFWSATRLPTEGHCITPGLVLGFTYAHAVVSSIGDWTFGILPAFIVKGLNMSFRTKASVFLILCLANVGSIATLVRIKAIHQISVSQDFLFATFDLGIWSIVELGIAIIAASIATLRPLFSTFYSIGSSRGTANRTAITANNSHRMCDSEPYPHSAPQNIGLQEMKRGHKTTLSQTSTTEIFGGIDLSEERMSNGMEK